jgi:tetratricopeptide (TPR) repeat protein/tRNA A-37 threonylcarbamoyl transferase component Bud32
MHDEERLLDLLLRWEALRQRGEEPTPEALCRDCPELLDELRRRLAARAAPDGRLGTPTPSLTSGPSTEPVFPPPPLGARVPGGGAPSRYRPLRLHARGGLGEVFVAEDQELGRAVALKRIRDRHAADPESRRRFRREAEITGRLEHPGVVPVYGLVRDADGQPCYAMRFVEGESLQEAIDRFHAEDRPGRAAGERSLALRQLLGRFVAVCNAVAYAHSRGVLHRDLKPANVMLGKYGETLVVDWGLAKLVDRPEAEQTPCQEALAPTAAGGSGTLVGQALGTPAFMSPEQAAGRVDELGPASDVYSLGVTLYVLLAGRTPFPKASVEDLLDRVRGGAFPTPRQGKAGVPAALDAVCRKAMALRPEARYGSAQELAGDVERWLADEPVSAYREPWAARLGRWARRHRPAVAAAAAAAAAVVVLGGLGAWWLQGERAAARQRVTAALERADALRQREHWREAREVLEQARPQLGGWGQADLRRRLEQARADLELVDRLDAIRLGRRTILIGGRPNFAGAGRDYAEAFREYGLATEDEEAPRVADRVRASPVRDQLIAALDEWCCLEEDARRRAWVLEVVRRADPDEGRNSLRDLGPGADARQVKRLLEAGKVKVADLTVLLWRLLPFPEGQALLAEVQRLRPDDFWSNFPLANALLGAGKPEEAVGYYRAALAVRPETATAHLGLGLCLRKKGQLDESLAEFRLAVERGPKDAMAHFSLGAALVEKGQVEEARAALRHALALLPERHPDRVPLTDVLRVCQRMLALERKLPAVVRGEVKPANLSEQLTLAEVCGSCKQRYADAARLYAAAFAAAPKLADDLKAGHRYSAACAAALAACGHGAGADRLDDGERAGLRRQARGWLADDLALWARRAAGGDPKGRDEVRQGLPRWKSEASFSGLRDAAALAQLPEGECQAWQKLWAEVDAVLVQAHRPAPAAPGK